MTTPNRDQIIRAHEALERLERAVWKGSENEYEEMYHSEAKDIILSILPPKPAPTMADIEWNDDKHYLAEAEHPDYGKVIMLGLNSYSLIDFFAPERYSSRFKDAPPEILTPTGKRYTLTEVQE